MRGNTWVNSIQYILWVTNKKEQVRHPIARAFSTDSSDSNPAPKTGDDQHVEELQL